MRPTMITLDLSALRHNFRRVREIAPHSKILAIVKANAYGHGAVIVAKALPEADAFGVASLDEGMRLREAGITQPIVLMAGLFDPEELPIASAYDFTLVVHHQPVLELLKAARPDKSFSVWLKVDTGMNRLGFRPDELDAAYQALCRMPHIQQPIGLMTHFAEADALTHTKTIEQMARFNCLTANYPGPRSLANSAGILGWPASHADWVRPGIMLYGVSPFPDKTGADFGLRPVMTFSSHIIVIKHVKQGEKIGYGGTWMAPCDMRIGVVSTGYGDGYPQFAASGTPVLINGIASQLVGRVSMDLLTVDLRPLPDAKIGDCVVFWGEELPVDHFLLHNKTFVYDLFIRITARPRVIVKHDQTAPALVKNYQTC